MIPLLMPMIVQEAPSDTARWAQMIKDGKVAEAVAQIQSKAAKGDAEALNYLGWLYDTGTGVPEDAVKAADAYRRAAEGGHKYAQWRYGVMLDTGEGGLKQDSVAALRWFEKSAAQGFTNAMVSTGVMYSNGRGVPVDHGKARDAYLRAVLAGNVEAPRHFAVIYAKGEGVTPDMIEAIAWLVIGMARGDEKAKSLFDGLNGDLDDAQRTAIADRANAIEKELASGKFQPK